MTAAKPAEIKALNGARALPPLMIVLFHICDAHKYVPLAPLLGPPVTKGYLWVEFFFALSGFILTHVYGGRALNYRAFLKARLARLYPVHLFTLLSIAALMGVLMLLAKAGGYTSIYDGPEPPLNTLSTFIENLFLVQAWNIAPGLSWNTVAWFVSVEFALCLVFPVYWRLAKGGAARGLALIAFGAAWLVLLAWNSGVGLDITFDNGVFRGMAGFAIGAGMAMVYRETRTAAGGAPDWMFSLAQAAVLLLLVWALYATGPRQTRSDLWVALALDLLILALSFDRGFLARALAARPLMVLGEWSFGIYMGQVFWMQAARQFDERVHPAGASALTVETVVLLVLCIAWGALITKGIERPANNFLRRH